MPAPTPNPTPEPTLWCWRHPPARGASGRCIGGTDLPVDRRKAKRLAHRLRQAARKHGLPRCVWVSPLQRARDVGRCLRRWGWCVQVDARLAELDFGAWDGLAWQQIAWAEVLAWQDDLLHHAPGGGEPLALLALRVQAFVTEFLAACDADAAVGQGVAQPSDVALARSTWRAPARPSARLLVTHGGWLNALLHLPPGTQCLAAADWPAAPRHGSLTRWTATRSAATS